MKIFVNLLFICMIISKLRVKAGNNELTYRQQYYGKGYGKDWIYFPDGDGKIHFVNLTRPQDEAPIITTRINLQIDFKLYTRHLKDDFIALDEYAQPIDQDYRVYEFLKNGPVKIVTHGWMSGADKSAVMDITNAYLSTNRELTVITVDWSQYSMNIFYPHVATQTKEVGIGVSKFINCLKRHYNVTGDRIHLIGHSLGAHVMGIAGYESEHTVGRITGLDPALPTFNDVQNEKSRLDFQDAVFVDIIHTCGGILGFWDAIGTADFYPNNGKAPQPGCSTLKNIFELDACSHGRSHIYYSESILNPLAFPAYLCNYWTNELENMCPKVGYMGEGADPSMNGIFYAVTNSEKPFGKRA